MRIVVHMSGLLSVVHSGNFLIIIVIGSEKISLIARVSRFDFHHEQNCT